MARHEELVRIFSPFFVSMRKMETMLKCPVCENLLEDPKFLRCDHITCRNCLPDVHGKRPTCPKCGKVHPKDARGFLFMEEMIKIFNEMDGAISDICKQITPDYSPFCEGTETKAMPPVLKKKPCRYQLRRRFTH